MLKNIVAIALLQAAVPAVAPSTASAGTIPAAVENVRGWQVAGTGEACIVHGAWRGGTVLSLFAMPEQEGIGFLIQNPGWTALREGGIYPLRIAFAGGSEWTIPAVARLEIDQDGPGLFFAVSPGILEDGRDFLGEFAAAGGMHLATGGATIERLALEGSHDATLALANCMRELVGGGSGPANPFHDTASAAGAMKI